MQRTQILADQHYNYRHAQCDPRYIDSWCAASVLRWAESQLLEVHLLPHSCLEAAGVIYRTDRAWYRTSSSVTEEVFLQPCAHEPSCHHA
eukprot:2456299-Prymnesium_polylepis.1